eukprot:gene16142-21939_t
MSGLKVFLKTFPGGLEDKKVNLLAGVLTTMIMFAHQTTGMGVSFIELSGKSITIVSDSVANIFCALIHDREDGVVFGRLICSEILNAFTQEFSSDLTQFGRNLKDFKSFEKKLINIIRLSTKPIISKLESSIGIKKVLFVNDREIIDTPSTKIDQLEVLANLNELVELSNSTMDFVYDTFQHITIDINHDFKLLLWKIQEKSVLIVVVDKKVSSDDYFSNIEEALEIIEQVCVLHRNLTQEYKMLYQL